MMLGHGVVRLVAVAHQHAARAQACVQLPGCGRAAARGVGEQPDRRAAAVGARAIGHLHPHVTLGLRFASRLLEHLQLGFVAVDDGRVQQRIAQQVHHRLHRLADPHDAGRQRVARQVRAAEAAQQRSLPVQRQAIQVL